MSEVGISHQNNYDIDQPDIVDLLVYKWQDLYPTELPIFAKHIGYNTLDCGTFNDLNTPIFTIPKYFVDLPSNISPRIFGYGYKWYQDVFVSRDMLQHDCHKPCWKERFVDSLPPVFAHKVKQVLMSTNDSLNYDNLTYDNIFNAIKNLMLVCVKIGRASGRERVC